MNTIKVIPHKRWRHTSGRTASIYGASPWVSSQEKQEWTLETKGFTWERTDWRGSVTIGLGRVPADTREAADRLAAEYASATGATVIH